MLLFGLGAGTPLVVLGSVLQGVAQRLRGRMMTGGRCEKVVLGAIMLLIGVAIFTGLNKPFESWAVQASPDGLTRLTTRF